MTPDPTGGTRGNPQTLDKYVYVADNPLTLLDPTGLYCAGTEKQCAEFAKALQRDRKVKDANVARAVAAYGKEGVDNGVRVKFGDPGKGKAGTTKSSVGYDPDSPNSVRANSIITISDKAAGSELDAAAAHEGSHAADAQQEVKAIKPDGSSLASALGTTERQSEERAYAVTSAVLAAEGVTYSFCSAGGCRLGAGVSPAARERAVGRILAREPYNLPAGDAGPPIIPAVSQPPE